MKRAVIVGACVVSVLALATGLWCFARPAYRKHREATAMSRAAEFMAARKYNEASLSARQALSYNPTNLQACKLMAEILELARAPQVLDWRKRVAQLAPTLENKLAVAVAAMQTQSPPFPMALQTLDELAPTATNSAAYHAVAAQLALRSARLADAAAHLEHACRLEPANEAFRLNLAVLRLSSTNESIARPARETLESLRSSTNFGTLSLRWLVADSVKRNELKAAEQLSAELLGRDGCILEDRLQHLAILEMVQAPSFPASLADVQARVSTNSSGVYVTASWMISHNLAERAAEWISNCPPKVRSEQLVSQALAECYVARKDWMGLETFLQVEKWGEAEFLRLAFMSLAAGRQNQSIGAEARWRSAMREAGDRLGPLIVLLRLTTSWGRNEAREELLWRIVQRFPAERWALRDLEAAYVRDGNTRGLYKVYTALAAYDSRSFVIRNNLASTALLLGVNLPQAHEQALEVFRQQPENPTVVSTYAFSLHLQGKYAEALGAMEKLGVEALSEPPVCLYYGLVLAAAGQHQKAAKYLETSRAGELLPEERALLAQATAPKHQDREKVPLRF
jgi:predicted Zn-dependent protease